MRYLLHRSTTIRNMTEAICNHCREITQCSQVGKYFLCNEHKDLKQYKVKEKKKYALKRTPIKKTGKPNQISKREKQNISNKKKAYAILAEQIPQICTGCGTNQNLTHSHLVPVGQNKKLEAVVSNITYHCIKCHEIWEHSLEKRKSLRDYEINMHKISILDPGYYNLVKSKE